MCHRRPGPLIEAIEEVFAINGRLAKLLIAFLGCIPRNNGVIFLQKVPLWYTGLYYASTRDIPWDSLVISLR